MKTSSQLFQRAYLDFDQLNIGGFDPLGHTSVKDLFFLVLHELDLVGEGEETDLKDLAQVKKAKQFLSKWGKVK